ncbi:MAG: hypothetical protein ACLUE8_04665 [Lachnospiraceae bacterium]
MGFIWITARDHTARVRQVRDAMVHSMEASLFQPVRSCTAFPAMQAERGVDRRPEAALADRLGVPG